MFTGLIEEVSKIKEFNLTSDGAKIKFSADFEKNKSENVGLNLVRM